MRGNDWYSCWTGCSCFACHIYGVTLQAGRTRRPGKRITSPEKWEINQLIKAGVLDVSEYPTFDAEDGQVCNHLAMLYVCAMQLPGC
jgi:hypothetical protein